MGFSLRYRLYPMVCPCSGHNSLDQDGASRAEWRQLRSYTKKLSSLVITSGTYYRARYYDSNVGRFISEDPVGFAGGMNFYAYAGSDPVDFTDPLGLCPPEKKKKCPLKVNLNFFMPLNPRTTQNIYSTLNQLFGPDIELLFSTADPNADLNVYVATIVPGGPYTLSSGEGGATPIGPNGEPENQSIIDLGQILALQNQANNAQLGQAIGQVIAHEMGHQLGLGHNGMGGIMSNPINPFLPNMFFLNDQVSIFRRCQHLRGLN